jgi:hypothetical protein
LLGVVDGVGDFTAAAVPTFGFAHELSPCITPPPLMQKCRSFVQFVISP